MRSHSGKANSLTAPAFSQTCEVQPPSKGAQIPHDVLQQNSPAYKCGLVAVLAQARYGYSRTVSLQQPFYSPLQTNDWTYLTET